MKYTIGILYWDNKLITRDFLHKHIAIDTMKSLGDLARRYPGTIKNIWII